VTFFVAVSAQAQSPTVSELNIISDTSFSAWVTSSQIAVTENTVHIIYIIQDTVLQYRRSIDGGNTFEPTINLAEVLGGINVYPKICAYQEHVFVFATKEDHIYFRRSNDRGVTWSDWVIATDLGSAHYITLWGPAIYGDTLAVSVNYNGSASIFMSTDLGDSWNNIGPFTNGTYQALAITSGSIHFVYNANYGADEVFYQKYSGGIWKERIMLSQSNYIASLDPCMNSDGEKIIVAWREGDGNGIYHTNTRMSFNGGVDWLPERVSSGSNMAIFWLYAAMNERIRAASWVLQIPSPHDMISYSVDYGAWIDMPAMVGVGGFQVPQYIPGPQINISDNSIHLMRLGQAASGNLYVAYQRMDFSLTHAQLVVNKTQLDFSASGEFDTLLVSNAGPDTLVGQIAVSNENFLILNPDLRIPPGESRNLMVKFQPMGSGGGITGYIFMYYNGDGSPMQVRLVSKIVSPVSPVNGKRLLNNLNRILFSWNKVEGATAYEIQTYVFPEWTSDTIFYYGGVVTDTFYNEPEFYSWLPGQWYYWRVRAITESDTGNWSEVWRFKTTPDYIRYGQIVTKPDWYLLSRPLSNPIHAYSFFEEYLCSMPAFVYQKGYKETDLLPPENGFWLKFKNPVWEWLINTGRPLVAETIAVTNKWNLIGSLTDTISVSSLKTDPPGLEISDFYTFDNNSHTYIKADLIIPGYGYWVKANDSGSIIMALDSLDGSSMNESHTVHIVPTNELPPPPPSGYYKQEKTIPKVYALYQNYPNPFNPATQIAFDLPEDSLVKLIIYNVLGQEVSILLEEQIQSGQYKVSFNLDALPSGVYVYRITAGTFSDTKKMILIK